MWTRRAQLSQLENLGQIGARIATRYELPCIAGQQGRHPRTMTAYSAVAVNHDADCHRAGAEGTAEAMIGVNDRHHVAEAKLIESETAHDLWIKKLYIAVAEIGVVSTEARAHDGGRNEMSDRRYQSMAFRLQTPLAHEPHRAIHHRDFGVIQQSHSHAAGIDLNAVSYLQATQNLGREVDQDVIDPAVFAGDEAAPSGAGAVEHKSGIADTCQRKEAGASLAAIAAAMIVANGGTRFDVIGRKTHAPIADPMADYDATRSGKNPQPAVLSDAVRHRSHQRIGNMPGDSNCDELFKIDPGSVRPAARANGHSVSHTSTNTLWRRKTTRAR